ncbi:hypothetical protein NDN08_005079 [Rhodosorus marinus]|uniref:Calcineurin-like phosphoesterase domain-containing protein n=1 Tax=Rhodosorus marinus TaxID=101924 RepID=A0AAV8V0H8_9RHOD|nr:hypothetical protein NDN08_005079 [Rhodosorus marinus]
MWMFTAVPILSNDRDWRRRSPRARPRTKLWSRIEASEMMPVVLLSDLHVDHSQNMSFVRELCSQTRNEAIIVAGDISHNFNLVEETLKLLSSSYRRVFFVAGNHELWVQGSQRGAGTAPSSIAKLEELSSICETYGVFDRPHRLDSVLVVPILSWYDLSLEVSASADLFEGFERWPWTDFRKCDWPSELEDEYPCLGNRYPSGVASSFEAKNDPMLEEAVEDMKEAETTSVLTYSHFLPGTFALPDWLKPESDVFDPAWFNHPAPQLSAKFSRVAGSSSIENQLRRLTPYADEHLHCFGHSHRPKDFYRKGIRYVHHPLGKPKERKMFLSPVHPLTKTVFDQRGQQVSAPTCLRYWESMMKGSDPLIECK